MKGFEVKQPGILCLLQDIGRYGYHGIGLTNGGPLDAIAFRWANRLCGNQLGATAIEITIGGLILEAKVATRIVLTGATMSLKINGSEQEQWCSHAIKPGDRIELGFATSGCRAYLAVAGGFQIDHSFGSASTVVRESIGGLDGAKLAPGDFLACQEQLSAEGLRLPEQHRPQYDNRATLRVVPGYQQHSFSRYDQRLFFSSEYQVSESADRMGFRLQGAKISSSLDGILSEGICHGAIQIPADGQPIVLMNDRQTIGGYPKIGSAISLDTAALAQLMPGGIVRFEPISQEAAHNIQALAVASFQRTEPEKI